MQIWLGAAAEVAWQLPVNPSEIMISTPIGNTTVQIQSKGDVSIIGLTGLRTISFSSFFPAQKYNFIQLEDIGTLKKPKTYVQWLKDHYRIPITLNVTGANIRGKFLINNFTYGSNDGTKDVQFTLDLMEYKAPKKQETKPKNKKYTVKKGDTLKSISKKTYKSSNYWRNIYALNKKVIEKAAKKHGRKSSASKEGVLGSYLYPGTKLTLGSV